MKYYLQTTNVLIWNRI